MASGEPTDFGISRPLSTKQPLTWDDAALGVWAAIHGGKKDRELARELADRERRQARAAAVYEQLILALDKVLKGAETTHSEEPDLTRLISLEEAERASLDEVARIDALAVAHGSPEVMDLVAEFNGVGDDLLAIGQHIIDLDRQLILDLEHGTGAIRPPVPEKYGGNREGLVLARKQCLRALSAIQWKIWKQIRLELGTMTPEQATSRRDKR